MSRAHGGMYSVDVEVVAALVVARRVESDVDAGSGSVNAANLLNVVVGRAIAAERISSYVGFCRVYAPVGETWVCFET